MFFLNQNELKKVNSLVHLGLSIGNQNNVEDFFVKNLEKLTGHFIHYIH